MPTSIPPTGAEGTTGKLSWLGAVRTAIGELQAADTAGAAAWAAADELIDDARVWGDAPSGMARNMRIDPTVYTASAAASALTIPTGVGTGDDIVEPMVLFDPSAPYLGYEYVLIAAPYYQSNIIYENPTLWVSHDGNTWVPVVNGVATPGGTATPLAPYATQGDAGLSDPYIVRGPDGTFYVLFNQILNSTGAGGTGTGGKNWSVKGMQADSLAGPWTTPVTLFSTILASDRPSTPSMFWDGTKWVMYAIDLANTSATTISYYTCPTANPLTGTWTKGATRSITIPAAYSTRVWWHLNAYRLGTQHVLLIQDTTAGTSGGGHIWLVTSNDEGTTWTVPTAPLLVGGSSGYRSAMVPMFTETGLRFDLFYGLLSGTWQLRRTTAAPAAYAYTYAGVKYGGLSEDGLPLNSIATAAARTPVAPYLFGDTCRRADSAVSPGSSDSGTAYTVSSGTAGISSNQLYSVVAANTRAVAVVAGLSDSVSTMESVVANGGNQAWLVVRYVDASNYVRFGWSGAGYTVQQIVAGALANSGTLVTTSPASVAGDVFAVVCSGTSVSGYVNGVLVVTATGWTATQAGSGIGFQTAVTTSRFRNLTARTLIGGA